MTITHLRPVEQPDAGQDPATTTPPAPVPEPATGEQQVTLELVEPAALVLDPNVRTDTALDKQFLASIRDHGVLVPVTAHRTADGTLHVDYGQRRTLAAVEAGLDRIPVYVVDVSDDTKVREVTRIIDQLAENDDRLDLSDSERVAAHQQLAVLGLTATQIARRTHRKVRDVRTSLDVADSRLAVEAMARYDLTVPQAAVLAEFDDDAEAVKALTVITVKEPTQFDHVVQRLRDKRIAAQAEAAATENLRLLGITVIPAPEYSDRTVAKLEQLIPADSEEELTLETHAGCPGHAAYLRDRSPWGAPPEFIPVHVCTQWRQQGHRQRLGESITGMAANTGGGMTEEAKAERRVVIANNKAWDSARSVRVRWLTTFLARRNAPKHAPQWIAATLAGCSHEVRRAMEDGHATALTLLGLQSEPTWRPYGGTPNPAAAAAQTANPARATLITLACCSVAWRPGWTAAPGGGRARPTAPT